MRNAPDAYRSMITYRDLRAIDIHIFIAVENDEEILELRRRPWRLATAHTATSGLYKLCIMQASPLLKVRKMPVNTNMSVIHTYPWGCLSLFSSRQFQSQHLASPVGAPGDKHDAENDSHIDWLRPYTIRNPRFWGRFSETSDAFRDVTTFGT